MTDDLRTRIAAVICGMDALHAQGWSLDVADAVIRELGMEREYSIGNDEDGRVLWLDSEEPHTPREGEVVEVRWISRWSIHE